MEEGYGSGTINMVDLFIDGGGGSWPGLGSVNVLLEKKAIWGCADFVYIMILYLT